jgi:putative membrane protein
MPLTTATTAVSRDFATNRVLQALAVLCLGVWIWAAIDPVSRSDWFLENLLIFAGTGLLVAIYRTRPISDAAHVFVAAFWVLHVIGSHYTYSEVPLGRWIQEAFALERNHYDRVVHFTFGLLLTYPVRELLMRSTGIRGGAALFFTFAVMVASSETYELIEWVVASIVSPEDAIAFLGTQGDVFDAQKDTGLAMLGTLIALAGIAAVERR